MHQLRKVFTKVKKVHYDHSLQVTEVESIIAYIRSSIGAMDLSEDKLGELKSELMAVLVKEGNIFITKDSGLFEASN